MLDKTLLGMCRVPMRFGTDGINVLGLMIVCWLLGVKISWFLQAFFYC